MTITDGQWYFGKAIKHMADHMYHKPSMIEFLIAAYLTINEEESIPMKEIKQILYEISEYDKTHTVDRAKIIKELGFND